MGWDDLNWLEDVHMGYEEGHAAVFDRNINGWVRVPPSDRAARQPAGPRHDRARAADQVPDVGPPPAGHAAARPTRSSERPMTRTAQHRLPADPPHAGLRRGAGGGSGPRGGGGRRRCAASSPCRNIAAGCAARTAPFPHRRPQRRAIRYSRACATSPSGAASGCSWARSPSRGQTVASLTAASCSMPTASIRARLRQDPPVRRQIVGNRELPRKRPGRTGRRGPADGNAFGAFSATPSATTCASPGSTASWRHRRRRDPLHSRRLHPQDRRGALARPEPRPRHRERCVRRLALRGRPCHRRRRDATVTP